ncbi:MAG: glutamyl-tRNA reductase [Gammaproteobacteria bacterium RBG_16_66_13]|nr:MAG: glutamyl-tRNA reductase [Gammaproteobacteria bacterium RBG_16_66_13]
MNEVRRLDAEIAVLGLNRRFASLDVRERLAFRSQELSDALRRCGEPLNEAVLLSTCYRTELYVAMHAQAPSRVSLEEQLGELRGIPREAFASHTVYLTGRQAVDHLFRVACGMDSPIVGEYQVLGQVREALRAAQEAARAGLTLDMLFRSAVRVGRQARNNTGIGRRPASVASAAAELTQRLVDLDSAHLVLVGTGKMGELVVQSLSKKQVGRLTVVGRTLERAQQLIPRCGDALSLEELHDAIRGADVVITATNAPHYVVSAGMVVSAMNGRSRPLWFVDLAVPRDVEPAVTEIPGVTVYNVDDLQAVAMASLAERQAALPTVLRLVEREAARFESWWRVRQAAPAVVALRDHFDRLRREELNRRRGRFRELTPEQTRAVEALTGSVLNKVLHHPTKALRRMAASGQLANLPQLLEQVFGVSASPALEHVPEAEQPLPNDTSHRPPAYVDSAEEPSKDRQQM